MDTGIVILDYNELLLDYNAYEEVHNHFVIKYAVKNSATKIVTIRTITATSLSEVTSIKALLQNILNKQEA